ELEKIKTDYETSVKTLSVAAENQVKQISAKPEEHVNVVNKEIELKKLEEDVKVKDGEINKLLGQVGAQDESIKAAFAKIQELRTENEKIIEQAGGKVVAHPAKSAEEIKQEIKSAATSEVKTTPKPLPKKASEQEINSALSDLLAAMEKYQNKKTVAIPPNN
ncbi:MAG: hypothetical protein FWD32_01650, partial [Firmicutes bacterium]|nr:hypothetical protein [Bacillota bacterium]